MILIDFDGHADCASVLTAGAHNSAAVPVTNVRRVSLFIFLPLVFIASCRVARTDRAKLAQNELRGGVALCPPRLRSLPPRGKRRLLGVSSSDRFGPAFRECQCRRREGPSLTFAWPGSPRCLDAVADETGTERRDQHGAHAVAPVGNLVRLRVDQQRLADIEPGKRDVFAVRFDVFSPEVARISSLGELRVRTGDSHVGKLAIEHALYG